MSSLKKRRALDRYRKKLKQGNRGYPVVTIAFYGPNAERATKVVVSLFTEEGSDVSEMDRWSSVGESDLRNEPESTDRILNLVDKWKPKSIVSLDRIIGCPHEEGIDYPESEKCPECPFWENRDRWTGDPLQ